MKVVESGLENKKTIMLLPGTSCTWEMNFDKILNPLKEQYHVLCVNYTGYDDSGEIFTTMTAETEKIEDYIIERFAGKLDAVYGSSMGGSFASLLLQRRRVHINHIFIGSSDMDQASPLVARLETALVWKMMRGFVQNPEKTMQKMEKKLEEKKMSMRTTPDGDTDGGGEFMMMIMTAMIENIRKADPRTIKNQFYSDLVTKIDDNIHVEGSTVHVFYAQEMGEKYLKRYHKHYENPDIIPFPCGHEGWLATPDKMMAVFDRCIKE